MEAVKEVLLGIACGLGFLAFFFAWALTLGLWMSG